MKPTLTKKPNDYAIQQLLVNFAAGVPLSADQLNFLSRHEKTLSHYGLDPALKYYLKPFYQKAKDHHSFLMHRENFDAEAAKELRKRLKILLSEKGSRVKLEVSTKTFSEFKNAVAPSLILYHGNQFLTGAPFHLGGIPHVIFFQWGNFFGVAKYVVLAEEKSLNSNVMVYFESMHERLLSQCVKEITKELRHELEPVQQPAQTHHLEKQMPHDNYRPSVFQTPKLTLSLGSDANDVPK
tara:strand:- start:16 stop:732 length:717 start_codon:yes stop_codon:yes gene_type:complete